LRLRGVAAALLVLAVPAPVLAQEAAPETVPAPETAPAPEIAPAAPAGFTAPGFTAPGYMQPGPAPGFTQPWPAPQTPGFITFAPAPVEPVRDAVSDPGPRRQGNVHFDLGFGTELPISLGGVGTLELPGRILLQLGLGFMPHGYAYAIDGALTSLGAYDQTVSQLIRNSLGNSFVLRASAGWRPF